MEGPVRRGRAPGQPGHPAQKQPEKIIGALGGGHAQHAACLPSGIGIDPGLDPTGQDQTIFDLFINSRKTVYIFAYRIFIIRGARSDNYKEFIGFTGKYILDHLISFFFNAF